jgi:hypothetical protein
MRSQFGTDRRVECRRSARTEICASQVHLRFRTDSKEQGANLLAFVVSADAAIFTRPAHWRIGCNS